ncbi:MAG: roadblock/LC7 domain-containing protein [Acidimicrobiia bacterium]|nr:roadblock/LC7 domain-containing protein [Acidimicrobiia bacterium]
MTTGAESLNWLIVRFVEGVPAVREAVVVSSDGLPLAVSSGMERETAERLSAVASGLIGLAYGSAGRFGAGAVTNVIIEMERGWLFVTGIRDGSLLCVVAARDADIGTIGYEMALFADRAGDVLTPQVRDELKADLLGSM